MMLSMIKHTLLPVVKWVGDFGDFSVDDNNTEVFHLSYINKIEMAKPVVTILIYPVKLGYHTGSKLGTNVP